MSLEFRQQLPAGRQIIDTDANKVVGTIYYTHHPQVPFECFDCKGKSKRVRSDREALEFIKTTLN